MKHIPGSPYLVVEGRQHQKQAFRYYLLCCRVPSEGINHKLGQPSWLPSNSCVIRTRYNDSARVVFLSSDYWCLCPQASNYGFGRNSREHRMVVVASYVQRFLASKAGKYSWEETRVKQTGCYGRTTGTALLS